MNKSDVFMSESGDGRQTKRSGSDPPIRCSPLPERCTSCSAIKSSEVSQGKYLATSRLVVLGQIRHRIGRPGHGHIVIGGGLAAVRASGRCTPSITDFRTYLVRSAEFESRARWRSLRVSQG